jgi:hypothetical protein
MAATVVHGGDYSDCRATAILWTCVEGVLRDGRPNRCEDRKEGTSRETFGEGSFLGRLLITAQS